jgi:hypothetical protein
LKTDEHGEAKYHNGLVLTAAKTMIRRKQIVPDFFDEAEAMRSVLDECFKSTYANRIAWQYFCDPVMYTYLRAPPQSIFPKDLYGKFVRHLREWCAQNLGLAPMNSPYLHLMVNGCRLGLHSDFHNGTWGYVYSLTRWQERRFVGGETLLMRDGIPSYKKHHVQGDGLYELVPALFNQLFIFDDRIVHGTPTIEGSMNPLDGRIALVGHIRATSPIVTGALDADRARKSIIDALPSLRSQIAGFRDVQGMLACRIAIKPNGSVESLTTLTDNLVSPVTGYDPSEAVTAVRNVVLKLLSNLQFDETSEGAVVIVPLLVPIPNLAPIECHVANRLSPDIIRERLSAKMALEGGIELRGVFEGDVYVVREPLAGRISIGIPLVRASFDPPMWVPSQRENFQRALSALLTAATTEVDGSVCS